MMVASEADEAWWPPTFRPSVLSRKWLALWIVQLASQSTLRSSAASSARSADARGIGLRRLAMLRSLHQTLGNGYQFRSQSGPGLAYSAKDFAKGSLFMPHRLDALDRKILNLLQEDGRMSLADLAAKVGLSPSPCLRRVRMLERAGVIARYVAVLDQQAGGL